MAPSIDNHRGVFGAAVNTGCHVEATAPDEHGGAGAAVARTPPRRPVRDDEAAAEGGDSTEPTTTASEGTEDLMQPWNAESEGTEANASEVASETSAGQNRCVAFQFHRDGQTRPRTPAEREYRSQRRQRLSVDIAWLPEDDSGGASSPEGREREASGSEESQAKGSGGEEEAEAAAAEELALAGVQRFLRVAEQRRERRSVTARGITEDVAVLPIPLSSKLWQRRKGSEGEPTVERQGGRHALVRTRTA
eukprot:CAMPEP_0179204226 /NCGR_PEP_ID=MMETSP0796-20121207/101807_1 /TAXON_ID=73915 /ORGANISM="Pyrodinium bahamense, Strain pbaha01" /LENGTH=249 /DNA_ID=CAMNT_0020909103 /DNA_START=39 /DNA_END=787 /DNA_ORIENTATION=+